MLSPFAWALICLTIGFAILGWTIRSERRARANLQRRFNLFSTGKETRPEAEAVRWIPRIDTRELDRRVRGAFATGMKHTWGMRTSSFALLFAGGLGGGATWLLSHHVMGLSVPFAAPIGIGAAFIAPRFILSREQKKAEFRFMDSFPDAIDSISRMLRAGLPMSAAIGNVASEGQPPVNSVFAMIADKLKIGVPIEETLDESSRTIGLTDFRFFTVAVVLQHATGGNLAATLEVLSDIIRKRRAARLKAKAATGEIRITAYALGSMPLLTTGALLALQPGYLLPLWTDPRGRGILMMACVALLLAYMSMRLMIRDVMRL